MRFVWPERRRKNKQTNNDLCIISCHLDVYKFYFFSCHLLFHRESQVILAPASDRSTDQPNSAAIHINSRYRGDGFGDGPSQLDSPEICAIMGLKRKNTKGGGDIIFFPPKMLHSMQYLFPTATWFIRPDPMVPSPAPHHRRPAPTASSSSARSRRSPARQGWCPGSS